MILAIAALPVALAGPALPQAQSAEPPTPAVPSAQPSGNPALWVTPEDYPPAALRAGASGSVKVRLAVNAAGIPTNCTITESALVPELDHTTCALLLRRARFRPVKDGGTAGASTWSGRFRWEASQEAAAFQPLRSWRNTVEIDVDADGALVDCKETRVQPDPRFAVEGGAMCAHYRSQKYAAVARGRPARIIYASETRVVGTDMPPIVELPGFETLHRDVVRFQVDAEGKPFGCEVVEDIGLMPMPSPCTTERPAWSKPDNPPATVLITHKAIVYRNPGLR